MQKYSWYPMVRLRIPHPLIGGSVLMILMLLLFTIPGEKGLVRAFHLKQELEALNMKNASLHQENVVLAQQAHLLKENMSYLEHVIIKEMNLVRPGDVIVVIKKKKN